MKPVAKLNLSISFGLSPASRQNAALEQAPRWRRALRASFRHPQAQRFGAQVHLRICDAAEARSLNRQHRRKNYVPNVLTFEYPSVARQPLQTDIAICWPVVQAEASKQGKSESDHFLHLLIHGFLHAQGFDHEQNEQARVMEDEERRILKRFRIADPYEN